jgi:hypothetical protein
VGQILKLKSEIPQIGWRDTEVVVRFSSEPDTRFEIESDLE